MNEAKHIGLDVHQATTSVSVLDFSGKLLMEAILETKEEVRDSSAMNKREYTQATWQILGEVPVTAMALRE
jgi:hypothetical protein